MNHKTIIMLLFSLLALPGRAGEISDCPDGQTCLIVEDAYTGPMRLFCLTAPALQAPWGIQARDVSKPLIPAEIRHSFHSKAGQLFQSEAATVRWRLALKGRYSGGCCR